MFCVLDEEGVDFLLSVGASAGIILNRGVVVVRAFVRRVTVFATFEAVNTVFVIEMRAFLGKAGELTILQIIMGASGGANSTAIHNEVEHGRGIIRVVGISQEVIVVEVVDDLFVMGAVGASEENAGEETIAES